MIRGARGAEQRLRGKRNEDAELDQLVDSTVDANDGQMIATTPACMIVCSRGR